MARRVTKGTMGLSNNCKNTDMRNTIQAGLWHRGDYSCRSRVVQPYTSHYDETSNNDELRLAKDGKVPQSEDEA